MGRYSIGIAFAIMVGIVSLLVRLCCINDIHPHHDEAPSFGLGRGDPIKYEGSLNNFISELSRRAVVISEADTTPLDGVIAECFRGVAGNNMIAARWFHAFIYSLGIGISAWLAWRIFYPYWEAILSVSLLAAFSIVSVIYGQFGEMYAIFFLAGTVQYLAYWLVLRKDYSLTGYLIFSGIAYICTLFEYLQVLLTAGLLLASVMDTNKISRRIRFPRAMSAGIMYAILNIPSLVLFFTISDFSAGFRRYYGNYYPMGIFPGSIPALIYKLIRYYIVRIYDLFNYHLSLVFDGRIYQPLQWNWIFLPVVLLFIIAIVLRFRSRTVIQSTGIFNALVSLLLICLLANALFLFPLGGVRNSLFLAPIIWLTYGAAVIRLTGNLKNRRRRLLISVFLVILTIIPFLLSLPGVFRDRISRVDWEKLRSVIELYRPDTLIMAQASYEPFLMLLQSHPEFYSEVIEKYGVNLTSFFEFDDARWGKYPLPVPGKKILALDLYISADGSREGGAVIHDHPTLQELCGPGWIMEPIIESPGKYATARHHQSIYYPPNSFYLYDLKREENSIPNSKSGTGD